MYVCVVHGKRTNYEKFNVIALRMNTNKGGLSYF